MVRSNAIYRQGNRKKKHIFEIYNEGFKKIRELEIMNISEKCEPNYWLSLALLSKESDIELINVMEFLEKNNIEAIHGWKAMHM